MKPLVREALRISQELGDVIFIGAIARYLYTKDLRESQDLDFAVERSISEEELFEKKYKKDYRNGKEIWYTPRGIKIDIYTDDVSKIPIRKIVENSKIIPVSKKNEKLRTMGIESLIIAKHRAKRDQDIEDLRAIAKTKYSDIDWEELRDISGNGHELEQIKRDMNYLSKTEF